ncbi:hypothetical protein QQF64_013287 [Cirrhinus molitorella]|uniref:Circadian-associated transcriptional repressor-like n=1 Tax=Cirrhinus molitorella TaxID=172907 RepID=A0ABR3LSY9_9TELE
MKLLFPRTNSTSGRVSGVGHQVVVVPTRNDPPLSDAVTRESFQMAITRFPILDPQSPQRSGRAENGQTGCSSASPAYNGQSSTSSERIPTEGDLRFARKCAELHGYIRPLLELLKGLKTGRYDKGLSTFQQSVAIDRLRRIVGVLQKPNLGEKYMGTLQQLEMMLKVWFPQVRPQPRDDTSTSSLHNLPPRWNQDQLHIPVKKRRLSWSDSDSQGSSSSKRFQEDDRGSSPSYSSSWLSSSDTTSSELEEDSPIYTNQNNMTPESKLVANGNLLVRQKKNPMTPTGRPPPLVIPPSATDGSSLDMQDCSVSSTTPTSDLPAHLMMSEKDLWIEERSVLKYMHDMPKRAQLSNTLLHC